MSAREDAGEVVVCVRLFAMLRQRAGRADVELRLPHGATVAHALAALAETESLRELIAQLPMRMAVNREYATPETRLVSGDELALIPPVSGGAGERAQPAEPSRERDAAGAPGEGVPAEPPRIHVRITEEPLSLERLERAVRDPHAGAIVVFEGVTRRVPRLDYEAYAQMAHERIERILRECARAHQLRAAAAEHRVGVVALSEPSVIVAVSAAHRAEAFAGAREAIDRIKAEAPIWKAEQRDDGSARWVTGRPPPLGSGEGDG